MIFASYSEPYPVPVLDFRKESDYNEIEQLKSYGIDKDNYAYGFVCVNDYVVENADNGKSIVFKNALQKINGVLEYTDYKTLTDITENNYE